MSQLIPEQILVAMQRAHPTWRPVLERALNALALAEPDYLPGLTEQPYLPTQGRLFNAFQLPLSSVQYVLVGEGPYPREASATGVCFMDGAVGSLWSEKGLSKQVNRATSLRNFMKMLLVADGVLDPDNTSGSGLESVAAQALTDPTYIRELAQLQTNLIDRGFLLLNASLVFRPDVPPVRDARAWKPFLQVVLSALAEQGGAGGKPPTLVLWGKIAEQLAGLEITASFPTVRSEHPYNLSFIRNLTMQELFRSMRLLRA